MQAVTNEADLAKKQAIVNEAQKVLDTAKDLGMTETEYNHYNGFISEAQKLVNTAKAEQSAQAKTSFLDSLKQKTNALKVATVTYKGDNITTSFNKPEENGEVQFIGDVKTAADSIIEALKAENNGKLTLKGKENEKGKVFDLSSATAEDIAEALLGGRLDKAEEFIKGNEEITSNYTLEITKGGVTFTLDGSLTFTVKAE